MTYGQRQTAFIQAACLPENSDTTAAARVARPADAARSSAFTGLLQMLAVSLFAAILLTLAGTPVNAWATESAASAEDAAEAATPTATAAAPTDLEATAAAPAASPAATPTPQTQPPTTLRPSLPADQARQPTPIKLRQWISS